MLFAAFTNGPNITAAPAAIIISNTPIVMPIHFKARFAVRFFILSSSFRSNLSFGSQTVKIKAARAQSASIPAS
jgi:hypothetical protein